jgi:hypothetical protein
MEPPMITRLEDYIYDLQKRMNNGEEFVFAFDRSLDEIRRICIISENISDMEIVHKLSNELFDHELNTTFSDIIFDIVNFYEEYDSLDEDEDEDDEDYLDEDDEDDFDDSVDEDLDLDDDQWDDEHIER